MLPKDLIINLIQEDLRNKWHINNFRRKGVDCSVLNLTVCHVILQLAGFEERPDELYTWYFLQIERAVGELTLQNFGEMMELWAERIYAGLAAGAGRGGG